MKAGQALVAGVPALPYPGGLQGGDCEQQPKGLWLTRWSTAGLCPVQHLPTLNSNMVSIPQLLPGTNHIFADRTFSWSQTSAAPWGIRRVHLPQANRSKCHSRNG